MVGDWLNGWARLGGGFGLGLVVEYFSGNQGRMDDINENVVRLTPHSRTLSVTIQVMSSISESTVRVKVLLGKDAWPKAQRPLTSSTLLTLSTPVRSYLM